MTETETEQYNPSGWKLAGFMAVVILLYVAFVAFLPSPWGVTAVVALSVVIIIPAVKTRVRGWLNS